MALPDGSVPHLGISAGVLARARSLNRRESGLPLFLALDGVLFFVLMIAYLVARSRVPVWPRPFHFPSGLMTVSMIMFAVAASFAMSLARRSAGKRNLVMTQRMLVLVLVGWGTFLFLLALEWARLYFFEAVTLLGNPWHVATLGVSYYGLSGYQAAHVLAGCVWVAMAAQHPQESRLSGLTLFVHFTNGLFVVVAFLVILSSTDLGGF